MSSGGTFFTSGGTSVLQTSSLHRAAGAATVDNADKAAGPQHREHLHGDCARLLRDVQKAIAQGRFSLSADLLSRRMSRQRRVVAR